MHEFLKGIHRALGVGVGYFPVAMSFGALATGIGVSTPAAVTMSIWVYWDFKVFYAQMKPDLAL